MKIYNYHPLTRELLAIHEAHLDPLETKKLGKSVYLLPALATFVAPDFIPEKGYVLVFNVDQNQWQTVVDNRGITYYHPDGSSVTIMQLGEKLPIGTIREMPPRNIARPNWDGKQWIETDMTIIYEKKIFDEIRRQAIERLIQRDELPIDYLTKRGTS